MDGSIRDLDELIQKGVQGSKYFPWIQLDVTKYNCSVNKKMIPTKLLTCHNIYKPASAQYFEKKLQPQDNTNWNHVFLLPRKVTTEIKSENFPV